jgi:hypothetical protein
MIYDAYNTFATALSVAAAAGTAPVGDTIDTSPLTTPWYTLAGLAAPNTGRAIGSANTEGSPLWLYVLVTTTFTSAGGATVEVDLVTGNTLASSNISGGTVVGSPIPPLTAYTALTAKTFFTYAIPKKLLSQYLQLQVVTATATTTAGSITAFLSPVVMDTFLLGSGWVIK